MSEIECEKYFEAKFHSNYEEAKKIRPNLTEKQYLYEWIEVNEKIYELTFKFIAKKKAQLEALEHEQ